MYDGEVLGKLPAVQHLKFGALLKWTANFTMNFLKRRLVTSLLRMYEGEVLGKLPAVQHLKVRTLGKANSTIR
jgi:hypothetical protein